MAVLDKKLHTINVVAGKAKAWVGLELQLIVERIIVQRGMRLAQALDNLRNQPETPSTRESLGTVRLKQGLLAHPGWP